MAIVLFIIGCLLAISVRCTKVELGKIDNMSLIIFGQDSVVINGTCNDCLCYMHSNPNFSSFNCYNNNRSCQMHQGSNQYQFFSVQSTQLSTFYFRSLPQSPPSLDCTSSSILSCDGTSRKYGNRSVDGYLWSFDASLSDQTSLWNFTSANNRTNYTANTIRGYGRSLSFGAIETQQISLSNPLTTLTNRSWTFEFWIYFLSVPNVTDIRILTQCQSRNTSLCLHFLVRFQKAYFGFYNDDSPGNQVFLPLRWYHLAFVFDCPSKNQSIYINGFLDATRRSINCFLGPPQPIVAGMPNWVNPSGIQEYLHAHIDELQYVNRSKSSEEILDSASLACYFPFDNESMNDEGPLGIVSTLNGAVNFTTGRIGHGLRTDSNRTGYFQIQNLVLLGTRNDSYSMALWIHPNSQQESIIIHVSAFSGGAGWCLPMLSIRNGNRLMASSWSGNLVRISYPLVSLQRWIHVALTYSLRNGLRLYIDGIFYNSTAPFGYASSGVPMYISLGNTPGVTTCGGISFNKPQYDGFLDEFRVYSRELCPDEIRCLANP